MGTFFEICGTKLSSVISSIAQYIQPYCFKILIVLFAIPGYFIIHKKYLYRVRQIINSVLIQIKKIDNKIVFIN